MKCKQKRIEEKWNFSALEFLSPRLKSRHYDIIKISCSEIHQIWRLSKIFSFVFGKRDVRGTRNRAARHEFKYHSLTLYLPMNWKPHSCDYVKLFNTIHEFKMINLAQTDIFSSSLSHQQKYSNNTISTLFFQQTKLFLKIEELSTGELRYKA